MHIAFVDIATAFTAASPYDGPLGGTQAAVAYLSAAMATRGIAVTLVNQEREAGEALGVASLPPEVFDDPLVLGGFTHIVFNGRWTEKLVRGLRTRTKATFIGWMHEACFQDPYILPLGDFNGIVFVSRWQYALNAALVPPGSRAAIIPNGVSPGFRGLFADGILKEKTAPPVVVYAGSSKRGLLALPEIIPLLHEAHPRLRFEIYSDAHVGSEAENHALRARLAALPNLDHLGAVDQKTLAQKFKRAAYLLGPNAYPETFCIVLAEAMAAGLRCITTARAALPETALGFAALTPFSHPDDPSWAPQFLNPERFAEFATAEIAAWQARAADEKEGFLQRQVAAAESAYNWAQNAESWRLFLNAL